MRELLWAGHSPELSSVLPTARVGNARFDQLGQVVRVLPPLADRRPLNVQRNVPNACSARIRTTTSTIRRSFFIAVPPSLLGPVNRTVRRQGKPVHGIATGPLRLGDCLRVPPVNRT